MHKDYNFGHYGPTFYNQEEFHIIDAIFNFSVLDNVVEFCRHKGISNIFSMHVFDEYTRMQYPDINFFYKDGLDAGNAWQTLKSVTTHPPIKIEKFLCSFIGSEEVGRQFVVSILQKMEMFDLEYCSKNFVTTKNTVDGNLRRLSNNPELHTTLVLTNEEEFFNNVNSFAYDQKDHNQNTLVLQEKIAKCFVNLVCETSAIGPIVTVSEKCLHSLICRGLFLCYAQKNWHNTFENCYGFKNYTKLFNYSFDQIDNPVERLVELIAMINKFIKLSLSEWNNLYELEKTAIEYNYDHFFSSDYIDSIRQYENTFNTQHY